MSTTLPKFRFEERDTKTNAADANLDLRGLDREQAIRRFDREVRWFPDRYTPHAGRRLVLLAVTR